MSADQAADENEKALTTLKVKDRVTRSDAIGSKGTVTSVRLDAISPTGDRRDRGVTIGVQWDNGTFSYFDPAGLVVV